MTRSVELEDLLLKFLYALEQAEDSLLFQDVTATQQVFRAATEQTLDAVDELIGKLAPEARLTQILVQALSHLRAAEQAFLQARPWPDFAPAFLFARHQQTQALDLLYATSSELTRLQQYFWLDSAAPPAASPATADDARGIIHYTAGSNHHEYSTYVPEHYRATQSWPLIVCLHGGYGRGDDYLWTWLRIARTYGYFLLSPKSYGATWSIFDIAVDEASVMIMQDRMAGEYNIDPARIYLTGLSDGASFGLALALRNADRYRAAAPVAGVFAPQMRELLNNKQGLSLPLHCVHGAKDAIFPVAAARERVQQLRQHGYDLTYTELLEWGHTLPYRINETIVFPWFEQHAAGA